MTLNEAEVASAARRLFEAEGTRRQIGHLSTLHPGMTIADSYRIQDGLVALKRAAGEVPTGWKIGLTSRAMQAALNIDTPDSGVLFNTMAFEDGATIPRGRFIQPRIEAELAFVLHTGLSGPDTDVLDVLRATEYVVPALEILDTRIERVCRDTGKTRTVCDTIADNAANAGYVLGGTPARPDRIDMRRAGAIVSRNGVVEETGLGAGVLNHPARGVAWLVRRLAGMGQGVEPGEIILSGSFIRPIETGPAATVTADYGPLGTISCFFE
ncbi:2-oxo-hept-4-ene-1,7-dioate hydratase [Azospirillum rugosum]|uniref:2-oxo-hept-3-ene-1,7-dioate hydratase n=1 Tax=Azospirillum rugosum TaxID=416170 RepID=A0ABS4SLA1_9PROT|nr:2-oxo-hepta-3-ene-1,7-dioic acid hydratase [Azospirillum rugosum]MBP2293336.1 2-oxo-hept-3-ene-1,7-dioate hydratase [Azospirillum rugosum]